ncbi:MAG TPA: acetyl-CoA hydrolase/transferase C-terminal domain-containing protein [Syntrophales bacterium]|nr:acetyl-CoA hydrolase/transferase C-terminal domain-containing protein [Syntrophales bacterium]
MGWGNQPKVGKISAAEAVGMIRSGQRVVLSPVCAEPLNLVKALLQAKDRLENVTLYTMMPMGDCEYARPEMQPHFNVKTFSVGPRLMEAVNKGYAEYIPCHLSQIPVFFRERLLEADIALIQLSPPDIHGYCSLGVSVSYIRPVLDNARTIIAEINDQMPRTLGDSLVHLSQVDYAVESSHPLPAIAPPKIGKIEKRIAEFTAEIVPDGAAIQVGIGNIADAILQELAVKKHLSVHTGTFSDGVMALVQSGAVEAKKGDPRSARLTATEIIGSAELYKFCDNNPLVSLRPIDFTHNIGILSQIRNLVSVTAGIQIDLMGQVNAEMRGETLVNGIGGQLDFLRGAAASPGGKAVIVFPSTAQKDEVSRIVAKLDAGITATVGRADIDYVITEYGIAQLRGKSLAERARDLIAVAHPNFREELRHAFNKTNS